jgi:hypothetical protein
VRCEPRGVPEGIEAPPDGIEAPPEGIDAPPAGDGEPDDDGALLPGLLGLLELLDELLCCSRQAPSSRLAVTSASPASLEALPITKRPQ